MSKLKETKIYNLNDFINWYEAGELEISPKYQRNSVWNLKAKSYLIDTILRGLPVPQVAIRQVIDTKTRKTIREVIDGQQRLRTILEFINDDFSILSSHNEELGNMTYDDLDDELKEDFLMYELPVEIIKIKEDSIIYDMFARLNTNNMALNRQELRNAKYWGEFKVFVYRMAAKWRKFFIDINMFSDKQLSRMLDIEYLSGLIALIIDGIITENQTKIDSYYEDNDEEFKEQQDVESKLERVLYTIKKIFDDDKYSTSYFHRKNYFYTLFAVITHMMFGIPNLEINRIEKYSVGNIDNNIGSLILKLTEFESYYERFTHEELYDKNMLQKMVKFEQMHRTRTTSQAERIIRVSILCNFIGSDING
ncbi:hypothetical protein Ccar_20575 [Clostridium carboxidivorans P7]|uniref:GmrSD restriction endonucleases N-terminal domain-containing protein n=1 Tax=Clostridium carboxidivorans P7 TaxID=536227 RepID=C6Q1K4_9CLOT|nr:DUF262 domain-containing protein [Clostridium carboxidivorans]AKN33108.1 hypothetical protein Ccar_20575 [Clostridium carboxidivorans P7]EET84621.1 protein of unknown function DUF262 [Clostridium carboxidivorans P7]EFG87964.1 hypothetical protein CLCAR_2282 [Clostridium carboxidivorans P7]